MAQPEPNTDEGWVSITELARLKGLGKAAISERVKGFELKGLLVSRQGKGKVKLVNAAEFDRVAGEFGDAAKLAGAANRRALAAHAAQMPLAAGDQGEIFAPIYTVEQARHMAFKAESAKLDLEERQGKILQVDAVQFAMQTVAEALVRAIDRLPTIAEDIATAVAKSGSAGARAVLKVHARELREAMDRELGRALQQALPAGASDGLEDGA